MPRRIFGCIFPWLVYLPLHAHAQARDCNGNGIDDAQEMVGVLAFVESGAFACGGAAWDILAVDVDDDGALDILTANGATGRVAVLANDGSGALSTRQLVVVDGFPRRLAAGDLDGDGDIDLIVGRTGAATTLVGLINDRGRLSVAGDFLPGFTVAALATIQADDDGALDLAVLSADQMLILRNDGSGEFDVRGSYAVPSYASTLDVGDLNGDGLVDIVVAGSGWSNGVCVYLSAGAGVFAQCASYPLPPGNASPKVVRCVDLNQDGAPDLAMLNGHMELGTSVFGIKINSGAGGYPAPGAYYPLPMFADSLVVGDFDRAGATDAAAGLYLGSQFAVRRNTGTGTFPTQQTFGSGAPASYRFLAAADLEQDGDLDIAVAEQSTALVRVFRNDSLPPATDCQYNGQLDECDIAQGLSSDRDANGLPDECDCPGDIDGDGIVSEADLAQLLSCYQQGACGDQTADGETTQADLALLLAHLGTSCP